MGKQPEIQRMLTAQERQAFGDIKLQFRNLAREGYRAAKAQASHRKMMQASVAVQAEMGEQSLKLTTATKAQTQAIKANRLRFTEYYSKIRLAWGAMKGLGRTVRWFTDLAGTQAQAQAKLNAVIYATGSAAGFTIQELSKHADALERLTEIDDQAVLSVQALLATFKEIRGPMFTRATEAVLDLGVVFGNIQSAAIQVGKALNDPIKGITALGRAGVQFTEQQKEQIKTLVYSQQIIKAQAIIMAEIEGQLGGTAAAIAEAGASWGRLANSAENYGEAMSRHVLPGVQKLNRAMSEAFDAAAAEDWGAAIMKAINWVAEGLAGLISQYGKLAEEMAAAAPKKEAPTTFFGGMKAGMIMAAHGTLPGFVAEELSKESRIKSRVTAGTKEAEAFAAKARKRRQVPIPPPRTVWEETAKGGKKPRVGGLDIAWKMLSTQQAPLLTEAQKMNRRLAEIAANTKPRTIEEHPVLFTGPKYSL